MVRAGARASWRRATEEAAGDERIAARFVQDLVKPVVPIAIDRVPRRAADLEELAAVGLDLLEQPFRRETAEIDLVHVHDDVVI